MELIKYMINAFSSECVRDEGEKIKEESLSYEEDFHFNYVDWLMSGQPSKLFGEIYRALLENCSGLEKRASYISFLTIPTINGFTVHSEDCRWSQDDFRYFFEYLNNMIVEYLAYEEKTAIREEIQYKDRHEVVERYHLLANCEDVDYSDIMLRLCYTDGEITSLKFCAVRTKRRIANFNALLKSIATA